MLSALLGCIITSYSLFMDEITASQDQELPTKTLKDVAGSNES